MCVCVCVVNVLLDFTAIIYQLSDWAPGLLQVLSASSSLPRVSESQFSLLQPSLASCLHWVKRPGFTPAGPHSLAEQVFQAFRLQVSASLCGK